MPYLYLRHLVRNTAYSGIWLCADFLQPRCQQSMSGSGRQAGALSNVCPAMPSALFWCPPERLYPAGLAVPSTSPCGPVLAMT